MVGDYSSSTGPSIVQTPTLWSQLSPTSLKEDQLSFEDSTFQYGFKDAALSEELTGRVRIFFSTYMSQHDPVTNFNRRIRIRFVLALGTNPASPTRSTRTTMLLQPSG
jgi:hypothetical protein